MVTTLPFRSAVSRPLLMLLCVTTQTVINMLGKREGFERNPLILLVSESGNVILHFRISMSLKLSRSDSVTIQRHLWLVVFTSKKICKIS